MNVSACEVSKKSQIMLPVDASLTVLIQSPEESKDTGRLVFQRLL